MTAANAVVLAIAGVALTSITLAYAADTVVTVGSPIVVTASRLDGSEARHQIGARVITAEDIERSRASTLTQLLQSLPEIRTRELPGSPNAQIDLRGFGLFGDQNTLVLLDGVRVREYEQLTVNWSAIPLASIERIEILPASSSVLYGGGATGGTINIITKAPQSNSRSAYLGAGAASHATREVRTGASLAGDSVGLRLHGSHYESDNYRDNNRVRIDGAQADVRWTGDTSSLGLKFGADDQHHGLPGVISEATIALNRKQAQTPNDFSNQRGSYVSLAAQTTTRVGDLDVNLGYRERDTGASFLVGTPFRNNVDTRVRTWRFAPQLWIEPQFAGMNDSLIIGGDYEDWTFDASAQPRIVGRPHSTQRSTGLYAQYSTRFATQTTLSLGGRAQDVRYDVRDLANPAASGDRSQTLHAWDVSGRQALSKGVNVYAKVGSSFRLPNVNDNYNPFFARVTLLEPQTARDWELGIEGMSKVVRFRAAFYRIDLDNEIFFDPVTLGSRNRQPTRRQGLQLEGRWPANEAVGLYANYIYADAEFRSGSVAGSSIAGNRVPLAPRHTLNAGLEWSLSSAIRVDFVVRHVSSSVYDADETNSFGRKIPAYTVVDLKLNLLQGGWLIDAGVRNLLGEKYFSYGVVTGRPTYSAAPAQERTLFVSAQYNFR